ncbi:hypothetical protein PoB_007284600 [Plakobranchus ocellatus]|uniref:Uncharacterized protein n=1 Tax=Plakobranchus ocellatus TaxID=259542 RepID=A0AAV4DQE4_9GAST|nr:hypothetical protein PoB_007284600 [Plakobranchus ocellatus]
MDLFTPLLDEIDLPSSITTCLLLLSYFAYLDFSAGHKAKVWVSLHPCWMIWIYPRLQLFASGGARTRDIRVPADLRADSLATVYRRPRIKSLKYNLNSLYLWQKKTFTRPESKAECRKTN